MPYLIEVFSNLLDVQEEKRIALIGFGNLGKALAKNNFRRNGNLNIVAVFDNNPELIHQEVEGFYVYSIEELAQVVLQENITVAITTVPSKFSQEVVNQIVDADITAILSFAPDRVNVPKDVTVQYIDLTTELQTLIFFDREYKK